MRVLAVGAEKGGSGKSTTTLFLAARAAERLKSTAARPRVAIVDRDDDAHLTDLWLNQEELGRDDIVLIPGKRLPGPGDGFALVLIDTPPGQAALASLREAHLVVVPCPPTDMNVHSLSRYLRRVEDQSETISPSMRLLAVLPTIVKRTTLHKTRIAAIEAIAASHTPPLLVLPPIADLTPVQIPDLTHPAYDRAAKELFDYAGL